VRDVRLTRGAPLEVPSFPPGTQAAMPHNSNYGPGPPLLHRARFPSALSGPKVGNTLKHSVQSRFVARESMMAKVVKLSHTSSTCQFRRRGHLQCWARVGRRGRSLSSLTGTSVGTKFSFGGGQLPDKCPAITASRHQADAFNANTSIWPYYLGFLARLRDHGCFVSSIQLCANSGPTGTTYMCMYLDQYYLGTYLADLMREGPLATSRKGGD